MSHGHWLVIAKFARLLARREEGVCWGEQPMNNEEGWPEPVSPAGEKTSERVLSS